MGCSCSPANTQESDLNKYSDRGGSYGKQGGSYGNQTESNGDGPSKPSKESQNKPDFVGKKVKIWLKKRKPNGETVKCYISNKFSNDPDPEPDDYDNNDTKNEDKTGYGNNKFKPKDNNPRSQIDNDDLGVDTEMETGDLPATINSVGGITITEDESEAQIFIISADAGDDYYVYNIHFMEEDEKRWLYAATEDEYNQVRSDFISELEERTMFAFEAIDENGPYYIRSKINELYWRFNEINGNKIKCNGIIGHNGAKAAILFDLDLQDLE